MLIEFSHKELTLVLFAMEGGEPLAPPDPDRCAPDHSDCPIVETLEEGFDRGLSAEKQLAQHLGKHLRQGWIDCGLLQAAGPDGNAQTVDLEAQTDQLKKMHLLLSGWTCRIELDPTERRNLYDVVGKLPRSAWITMPRTIWRLRKKLKAGKAAEIAPTAFEC
jgi:hypothetical protein